MAKKLISIPVSPHIKKYLESEYPTRNGIIQIQQKIIPPKFGRTEAHRDYFTNPPDHYLYIKVETYDSRLYKLYAWKGHVEHSFIQKMIDYVAARYRIMYTSEAIREFLALYEITESEYSYETAYKNWQRSKTYKLLKKKHPSHARNQQTHV